jgi:hypothetical protein
MAWRSFANGHVMADDILPFYGVLVAWLRRDYHCPVTTTLLRGGSKQHVSPSGCYYLYSWAFRMYLQPALKLSMMRRKTTLFLLLV